MNARRFFQASPTVKLMVAAVLLCVGGAFAACSFGSASDSEMSGYEVNANGPGRLPYRSNNNLK